MVQFISRYFFFAVFISNPINLMLLLLLSLLLLSLSLLFFRLCRGHLTLIQRLNFFLSCKMPLTNVICIFFEFSVCKYFVTLHKYCLRRDFSCCRTQITDVNEIILLRFREFSREKCQINESHI